MGQYQHDLLPRRTHDEAARQSFAQTLGMFVLADVAPGTSEGYEFRAKRRFVADHGRPPETVAEVGEAMVREPLYQVWGSLRRAKQQLMWESVETSIERQIGELVERARARASDPKHGTLTLDPDLEVPWYEGAVDVHLMPGGYHGERGEDDVFAGALYDRGIFVYRFGTAAPLLDAMGRTFIDTFIKPTFPDLEPRRILDIGCAVGSNTVPYAEAFPEAEVYGIDVAAPCLRYAHARAESLGKRIHFVQANGEHTDFPDGFFDLIVSHVLFHETPVPARRNIFREGYRLLAPGGVMAHIDARSARNADLLTQYLNNWVTMHHGEPCFESLQDLDFRGLMAEAGIPEEGMIDTILTTWRGVELGNHDGMFVVGARKAGGPAAA